MENKKDAFDGFLTVFGGILEDVIKKENKKTQKTDVEKLANDHWGYIQGLLVHHGENDETIKKIGYHYMTAFIHGYKHAMEEK